MATNGRITFGKTRPISSKFPDRFIRDGKDVEDLKLFVLNSGAYRDVTTPRTRGTRLSKLVSGRKTQGASIRGGSV